MGFVPARCTQCGAEIKVDDTKDAGICEYCGTAFVTEKAINYITNDFDGATINVLGGNFENYLHLAESALWANNGFEACSYANKALEMDAFSSKAWLIKMKAVALIPDSSTDEIITYGINAISYAEDVEATTNEVYMFYLSTALSFLHEATRRITDTSGIMAEGKAISSDSAVRDEIDKIVHNAWILKISVPKEDISKSPEMRDLTKCLVNEFMYYCRKDAFRVSLYDGEVSDFVRTDRANYLNTFKEGLNDDDILVTEMYPDAVTDKSQKKACYIATAVYGSYDCPAVLVLRHFRDSTLSRYSLGRMFIACYYKISPILVKYCGKNKLFLYVGRSVLDKVVEKIGGIQ